MRWSDLAQWVGPTPNQSGPMVEHRGVVIHIAAGYYLGTIAWQKNPDANVSSHFIVAGPRDVAKGVPDGRIGQMVDTGVTAWTQRDGNGHWLSVEFSGFVGDKLSAAQIEACARILARAHTVYGVPLQLATSPTGRGLGHHSMGAETGYDWGHSACPGEPIKAQKPQILARAIEIVNGDEMFSDNDREWLHSISYRALAILSNAPSVTYTVGSKTVTEPNKVYTALAALDASIDAVAAAAGMNAAELEAVKSAAREGAAAALTPEALALAIPDELAAEVVQLLGERQAAAARAAADVLAPPAV